ncbi:large conductance mechanosensitive channel protein MscL [Pusillimonas sp. CC-YST705]|uniref:Large-conductance mechanosensitive channel n=1 Tax=Mesopusillimonas faecipullorum TaxID=2755040 RepID=A0ABS8CC76_9BURK|nr:large conductance mechanosensitive channel protein MscL [Mesopusillimonas faecipullorum]MCB5363636.1 large conductance mechanosensitive channel protein MscL [Mesopusillimonas faecipullorum]
MSNVKGFIGEFREFAIKGNMVDLAVGVIIGAAFGKIIDALVRDIIMPIISFILGGQVDFTNLFFVLKAPENYTGPQTAEGIVEAGGNVLAWGNFATVFINFLLLAFVVFLMVKAVNRARARYETPAEPEAPAATPDDVVLLREIRDLLKK